MAVHSISRWDFAAAVPKHFHLDRVIGDETEWFADDAGDLIGTVATHRDGDWGYALLGRDDDGSFRVCKLKQHLPTYQVAETQLLRSMKASESGRHPHWLPSTTQNDTK